MIFYILATSHVSAADRREKWWRQHCQPPPALKDFPVSLTVLRWLHSFPGYCQSLRPPPGSSLVTLVTRLVTLLSPATASGGHSAEVVEDPVQEMCDPRVHAGVARLGASVPKTEINQLIGFVQLN